MSSAIYLLLQVPAEDGSEMPAMPGNPADLQRLLARSGLRLVSGRAGKPPPAAGTDTAETVKSLEEVERDYIVEILSRSGGNRSKAARMLNISRRTLQRKMARFA